ncbi:unnamed protein product [Lathyrus sativus]|nr:unnamed protein product [Lathyrus sativus]
MGKRGVSRPKKQAKMNRKQAERTIVTKAVVESIQEEGESSKEDEKEEPSSEELEVLGKKEEVQPKPWVDVIQGNCSLNRGMTVGFVAPKIVNGDLEIKKIEQEDVTEELEFWENAIILFALGESLPMNAAKKFMEKTWNFVVFPDLYYNE